MKEFVKSFSTTSRSRGGRPSSAGGSSSASSTPRGTGHKHGFKALDGPRSDLEDNTQKHQRGTHRRATTLTSMDCASRSSSVSNGSLNSPPFSPIEDKPGLASVEQQMATVFETEDHKQTRPSSSEIRREDSKGHGKVRRTASRQSSLSSSSLVSLGASSWSSSTDSLAREVDRLTRELEEERLRSGLLMERKALLAAEAKRARGERDDLAREQGRLTEKLSQMEGQMLDMRQRYEVQLVSLRKKLTASAMANRPADQHKALVEQVHELTQENEELRQELGDAVRSAKFAAAEKEAASIRVEALKRELDGVREDMEAKVNEWHRVRERLEHMIQEAAEQAGMKAREVDHARAEAVEKRNALEYLRQEMESKLAAAEAQIAHQSFELAAAHELAEEAEAAKRIAQRKAARLEAHGEECDPVEELENEVSQLLAKVAEKEVELRQERERRELAETESREMKEAMDAQADMVRDKIRALKKEKEAATSAAERRAGSLQREITLLLEQKEAFQDAADRAKAEAKRADDYLKAMDVARLEVKRLRVERDLLVDKLQEMEKESAAALNVTWWVPNCLAKCAQIKGQS